MAKKPAKRNDQGLSDEEERFVEEYLIDRNATAAYQRVHPHAKRTTAGAEGHKLLKKPEISNAIKLGSIQLARQCNTSAVREVREMALLANYDIGGAFDLTVDDWVPLPPRRIPYETRKAIVGFKITRRVERDEDGNKTATVENVEYKFVDKLAARDKLMRHLGLYKDLPAMEVLLAALEPAVAEVVRRALSQAVLGGPDRGGPGGHGPGPELPPGPGGGGPGGRPGGGVPPGGPDPGPVAGGVPPGPLGPPDDAVLPPVGENDGGGGENPGSLFG